MASENGEGMIELKDFVNQDVSQRDNQQLSRLGKNPVLKRTFGFLPILGFSCTVLITWEGYTITLSEALPDGGPAGVIWGFLINWVGILSVYTCVSELVAMAPTAGGQYHWVGLLAPVKFRSFLSYLTAWTTVVGWQAVVASNCYLNSVLIQGMIGLGNDTYEPHRWQTMLLFWAQVVLAVFINTVSSRTLARFEGGILILHLLGFFAILVPLVYYGPHGDAASVFTRFVNEGGWTNQTLSFFVGLPAAVFAVIGADCCVHMSEEVNNATRNIPLALVLSTLINGTLGFAMAIALMFCIGDLQDTIDSTETLGFPFIYIYQQAVQNTAGAILMVVVITIMAICAVIGTNATASRMLWAFARDGGPPFAKQLYKLDSRTKLPVAAIASTAVISILLSLIILGSTVAFSDLVSLSVAGLFSSYLIVCILLLWRRTAGHIKPQDDLAPMTSVDELRWGPWRVPGVFGIVNNAFACLYITLMLFWSFWPPAVPVNPQNMNYSSLVFGSVIIFSVLWYWIHARHTFKGPLYEQMS